MSTLIDDSAKQRPPSALSAAEPDANTPPRGLTAAEVAARRANGMDNRVVLPTSRSYLRIVRDNVVTFVNGVLFGLAVALIALGRPSDALISVGVVAANLTVGLVQEIHAKRVLDRIAILARPRVTIIRDGIEQSVHPEQVVVGDLLAATAGDQIVADGIVVGPRPSDTDEALLTGESRRVPKRAGDRVFAGTFCAGGTLQYIAEGVGANSTASQLATSARVFRRGLTPLQHEINRVVRVSLAVVVVFEVLVALANVFDQAPVVESVRMAIVIAGLIPNGLFLAVAVAYAMGALRMAGKGALVQQANAVESLSHIDVLCLDKTGTLTTNAFNLAGTFAVQGTDAAFRAQLGGYAAASSDTNRTVVALRKALPSTALPVADEVLFSSVHKWSGLTLAGPAGATSYVLGAPDILQSRLRSSDSAPDRVQEWLNSGLRVLLLARAPGGLVHGGEFEVPIPGGLEAVGYVALSDELRPDVARTLAGFAGVGVQLRLLSGDDPRTVGAVASQAGLSYDRLVSGSEVGALSADALSNLASGATVFGRLTPDQKKSVIRRLRADGRYVAMIGDGINDVPALKAADLAIAMQSGSAAARAVADLVLLQDRFGALPAALREGQRIRGGMHAILKLFLTRVLYMALLIVLLAVVDIGFPFAPKQNALVTLMTVGLPTLALAAWARPLEPRSRTPSILPFVASAACTLALVGLGVYMGYLLLGSPVAVESVVDAIKSSTARAVAQTALTTVSVLCGLLLVVMVQPHGELISRWQDINPRHAVLAATLFFLFSVITTSPWLRAIFELQPLSAIDCILLACIAGMWVVGLHWIWRHQLIARLLGTAPPVDAAVDTSPGTE
jgi:cation-transporting ATPase E